MTNYIKGDIVNLECEVDYVGVKTILLKRRGHVDASGRLVDYVELPPIHKDHPDLKMVRPVSHEITVGSTVRLKEWPSAPEGVVKYIFDYKGGMNTNMCKMMVVNFPNHVGAVRDVTEYEIVP